MVVVSVLVFPVKFRYNGFVKLSDGASLLNVVLLQLANQDRLLTEVSLDQCIKAIQYRIRLHFDGLEHFLVCETARVCLTNFVKHACRNLIVHLPDIGPILVKLVINMVEA